MSVSGPCGRGRQQLQCWLVERTQGGYQRKDASPETLKAIYRPQRTSVSTSIDSCGYRCTSVLRDTEIRRIFDRYNEQSSDPLPFFPLLSLSLSHLVLAPSSSCRGPSSPQRAALNRAKLVSTCPWDRPRLHKMVVIHRRRRRISRMKISNLSCRHRPTEEAALVLEPHQIAIPSPGSKPFRPFLATAPPVS